MDVRDRDQDEFSLDTWLALVAGPNPWSGSEEPSRSWVRMLCLTQLFALAVTSGVLAFSGTPNGDLAGSARWLGLAGVAALAVQPLLRVAHREPISHSMLLNVFLRVACMAAIVVSMSVALPQWDVLRATPFAVAIGLDGALTCEQLGWDAKPFKWYLNLLRSGLHLGIVGAVVAAIVADVSPSVILPVFVTVHVWAATAVLTLWATSSVRRGQRAEVEEAVAEVVGAERRARAHWLHDDVCAHLRLVSLKVQTSASTTDEVLALLDDFDHQLRLRQLDELLGTGAVRVGELLQPYIRNVQNHGVDIVGVPSFEDAALSLPEEAARKVARTMKVLTSNALNAGATTIAYEAHVENRTLRIVVHDDATGFELSDVPHGRGLWTLMEDLRPGGLEVQRNSDGGATVTARIPLDTRRSVVQAVTR